MKDVQIKRRILLTCLFLQACIISCLAQDGYKIVYSRIKHVLGIKKTEKDSTSFFEIKIQKYLLYCNDSMAYSLLQFPEEKSPYSKKDTVFGKKVIHHAITYQRNSGYSYHYKAFPNKRKPQLLWRKENR